MKKLATILVIIALLVGGLAFGTTITATPVEVTGRDFVEFD